MIKLFVKDKLTVTCEDGISRELMAEFWVGVYRRNAIRLVFGDRYNMDFELGEDKWGLHIRSQNGKTRKLSSLMEDEFASYIKTVEEDYILSE